MESTVWRQFYRSRTGLFGLVVILLFALVGIYAPFLASSKPLVVVYDGRLYFPLFRYLFFTGFYTKRIDLFFNILMFTLPLAVAGFLLSGWWRKALLITAMAAQLGLFLFFSFAPAKDPGADLTGTQMRQASGGGLRSWSFDVASMGEYARLGRILRYQQRREMHDRFVNRYEPMIAEGSLPTLWAEEQRLWSAEERRSHDLMERLKSSYEEATDKIEQLVERYRQSGDGELFRARAVIDQYEEARARLAYLADRRDWLEAESKKISFSLMPLIRPFHWEEDAGGGQSLNRHVRWYDLTRANRKDLVASLLFGIRISLTVGLTAVGISLLIGIPLGALSGYRGGWTDIWVMRAIEIWESMPTFFMLLMVVAILQTKSVFIVIGVLGIFGWTGFARYLRSEVLKQRSLAYVEACRAMGYSDLRISLSHILPNAIPPLLTLLPFSVMVAITSEAGLSFLGLGEEGSTSWGVLMDEGRSAFPAESYLLWPPAILLTLLLVAIALVGDALRDALDPKMR